MWRATVLTIFPDMFPGPLGQSLAGKALAAGIWSLEPIDIRSTATDTHRTVDDTPAGGGPGMVMKADVLAKALDAIPADPRPRLLMSARGAPLTQNRVAELARGQGDRKSTRLNSSHLGISYAVFCLKKKKNKHTPFPYDKQKNKHTANQ